MAHLWQYQYAALQNKQACRTIYGRLGLGPNRILQKNSFSKYIHTVFLKNILDNKHFLAKLCITVGLPLFYFKVVALKLLVPINFIIVPSGLRLQQCSSLYRQTGRRYCSRIYILFWPLLSELILGPLNSLCTAQCQFFLIF